MASILAPDAPEIPDWSRLKVFLWGALWAVLGALAPVVMMLWDWAQRWTDPIDWGMISHQALVAGGLAAVGFWRKHRAWLMQPPGTSASTQGEQ